MKYNHELNMHFYNLVTELNSLGKYTQLLLSRYMCSILYPPHFRHSLTLKRIRFSLM